MSSEIEQKLIEFISVHAEVKPETLNAEMLISDTGIDSLGTAELIFDLEDHYDITLDNTDALSERFKLGTIKELAAKLQDLIS